MKHLLMLSALAVALALPGAALAGASHAKFEFGVVFPDGTAGEIYAGSKTTGNGSTFTSCGYVGEKGAFLGDFQTAGFASTNADELRQFCLDHYEDRS